MPRPIAAWPPQAAHDESVVDAVGTGRLASFNQYAREVLRQGYPESLGVSLRESQIQEALDALDAFNALSQPEITQVRDEEHDKRVDDVRTSNNAVAATKGRHEAMLAQAGAFVPPSPAHQVFADFLVNQLTQAVADSPLPRPDPPIGGVAQFKARRQSELQAEIDRLESAAALVASASDNQWVKDLQSALV